MTSRVLPSQARLRALAELDALLARAEQNHAAYLALAGVDARRHQGRRPGPQRRHPGRRQLHRC